MPDKLCIIIFMVKQNNVNIFFKFFYNILNLLYVIINSPAQIKLVLIDLIFTLINNSLSPSNVNNNKPPINKPTHFWVIILSIVFLINRNNVYILIYLQFQFFFNIWQDYIFTNRLIIYRNLKINNNGCLIMYGSNSID